MTRVRVTVAATPTAYEVKVACPEKNWEAAPRTLERRPDFYPVPDESEAALWQGAVHADICVAAGEDERKALHGRILVDPSAEDVKKFGGYLFAVLFGPAWAELRKQLPNDALEIQILAASEAVFFDSLPWELMWKDAAPLIAQDLTISRLVERKGAPQVAAIETPPRVLFVVGELDDELRPGAEYIEILHSLGRQGVNGTRVPGAALPVRSIVDADAAQVADAVKRFAPHIVHFVAHGLVDGNRAVIRLTRREQGKPNTQELCHAERLLELLTPGGMAPPAVVVMNACHTADEVGLGGARALAAELVRGGVPAAIGMAGEVASSACRVFARAFYRTFAEAEPPKPGVDASCPVQKAVANGQRAARRHSTDAKDDVEWGRPSLFVAEGANFPLQGDGARDALIRALANVSGSARQMLGRAAALREYENFMGYRGDGAKRLLAFAQSVRRENLKETEEVPYPFKLGKTTLLAQIKARALLDGFVPLLVESYSDAAARPPPPNLLYLSMRLAEVMDEVRASFGISRRVTSNAQKFVFKVLKKPAEYVAGGSIDFDVALGEVKAELTGSGVGSSKVDPPSVATYIRQDIDLLLQDVKARCPAMKGALILLDDIHRYQDYWHHVFDFLDPNGLGTPAAPAPLIVTFEDFTEEGKRVADRLGKLHGVGDFTQQASLAPFSSDAEGRVAYSQYLLSLRLCGSRGKSMRERFDGVLEAMHKEAHGVPSFLKVAMPAVRYAERQERPSPLAKADDEAVFLALQKEP